MLETLKKKWWLVAIVVVLGGMWMNNNAGQSAEQILQSEKAWLVRIEGDDSVFGYVEFAGEDFYSSTDFDALVNHEWDTIRNKAQAVYADKKTVKIFKDGQSGEYMKFEFYSMSQNRLTGKLIENSDGLVTDTAVILEPANQDKNTSN